jgi:hypothetical protein
LTEYFAVGIPFSVASFTWKASDVSGATTQTNRMRGQDQ